jgi:hypothetical protein
VVYVKHNTMGDIAEIYNPFRCLERELIVRAPMRPDAAVSDLVRTNPALHGKEWYHVVGSMCQAAAFCPPLPCGPCRRFVFHIYDASDVEHAHPVGEVARIWPGCLRAAFAGADADTFTIAFPDGATEVQKAALTASVILLDFLLFEKIQRNHEAGIAVSL